MEDFEEFDIADVLNYISPSSLSYQDWINIGMALKYEGYTVTIWDRWSMNDNRYHSGECEKKWETFNGAQSPVTGATIIKMAKDNGWTGYGNHELDWDSEIGGKRDDLVVVDKQWVEGREIKEPTKFDPVKEITTYLETLFEPGENVGYVVKSWKDEDGKYKPANKGNFDRTAGTLIEELSKSGGDIGAVLGDYDRNAGAWIRFNPLDGKGAKNQNVTEFRYALVESDSADIEKQNAIIRELELPVACLVYSGGKSVHAIVKVDASDYNEYRKRVDYLYSVCQKNGLEIDTQNKNPSRLSRLPGVERGEQRQYIVDTNIGKSDWNEWKEWIESVNDELPDLENLADVWGSMPDLAPPLIDGVLRQGHKMLIAGPSKAGKSYALLELCCAIAEGTSWLGFNCTQGRVMYVNLELDKASCLHRLKDVYTSLGLAPNNISNIDMWHLRGKTVPMDKLAPRLIRRASKKNYIAVIIDPIYKVITGDENSADQMAHFCNQFDKVCTELGCAVIYCHHHSKGAQGSKAAIDRASGSGVFARDPDAILDVIELNLTESVIDQEKNKAVCSVLTSLLTRAGKGSEFSQDDACSAKAMRDLCYKLFDKEDCRVALLHAEAAEKAAISKTAWRIEGTLREFPKLQPFNVWFDYPIHRIDTVGTLNDLQSESERSPWQRAVDSHKKSAEKAKDKNRVKFENAVALCNMGDAPTLKQLSEYLSQSDRTTRLWITNYGYMIDKNTGKVIKTDSESNE